MLKEAQALHATLVKRAAKTDAPTGAQLRAFDVALMRLADLPPDDAHTAPPAPAQPNGLTGLLEGFRNLAEAVDGADGAPTPDAESGFRQRTQMLAALLAEWSALKPQIATALSKAH